MKARLLIVLAAVLALLAGVALRMQQASLEQSATVSAELQFSFPDVNGQPQSVSQWRGKILVINFWATWCPPCLKEIPEFMQWQQEFAAKGVQFVGIALDEQQAVADYLQKTPVNYPMLVAGDAGSVLARQFGNIINAVPFTVVVDGRGQIVHRQPGEMQRDEFLRVLRPLLEAND